MDPCVLLPQHIRQQQGSELVSCMNLKSGEQQGLAELALQWAQIIETSERPAPFSQQRSYLVADFKHLLLKCCCHLKPDQQRASGKKGEQF